MCRLLCSFLVFCMLKYVSGYSQHQICGNNTQNISSCITQILGEDHTDYDKCKVERFPSDSAKCKAMNFGPIASNAHIGGVSLKPYILPIEHNEDGHYYTINNTVLNITFSSIKWKTMKFRFQISKHKNMRNHCRNIMISNDLKINDRSVLYYDCYWSVTDSNYNGQSHILDFEATDDKVVNRGQYYFNIPSAQMLSPTITEKYWKPFVYIEILLGTMKLHILPPPTHLKIDAYQIEVMKECDKGAQCEEIIKNITIPINNNTEEVTYEYSMLSNTGSYYFVVTPIHDKCKRGVMECQAVESPRITISNESQGTLNVCIASATALVVATLFMYYIVLRLARRYWCRDYRLARGNEIPAPTKVLAIYSPANRLHAECVASFVNYLRSEYGFQIMYDGDIPFTSHGDPYIWAEEAFRTSTHVMYIVGPAQESNTYNNIYEKPIITPHKDVDVLLLSFLKASRTSRSPKEVLNVFFEHSNGQLPVETRHDRVFFLLKDWHKLISYLSKNLLPKKQIMRTEKGRCLMEDLTRAKKLLSNNSKNDDFVVKCDRSNWIEKKVLL